MFSLQVLGAVAKLERALIAERTKAGRRAARSAAGSAALPGTLTPFARFAQAATPLTWRAVADRSADATRPTFGETLCAS
jgi:DNA invertase Pin-like site-specific DNA recombinase